MDIDDIIEFIIARKVYRIECSEGEFWLVDKVRDELNPALQVAIDDFFQDAEATKKQVMTALRVRKAVGGTIKTEEKKGSKSESVNSYNNRPAWDGRGIATERWQSQERSNQKQLDFR